MSNRSKRHLIPVIWPFYIRKTKFIKAICIYCKKKYSDVYRSSPNENDPPWSAISSGKTNVLFYRRDSYILSWYMKCRHYLLTFCHEGFRAASLNAAFHSSFLRQNCQTITYPLFSYSNVHIYSPNIIGFSTPCCWF